MSQKISSRSKILAQRMNLRTSKSLLVMENFNPTFCRGGRSFITVMAGHAQTCEPTHTPLLEPFFSLPVLARLSLMLLALPHFHAGLADRVWRTQLGPLSRKRGPARLDASNVEFCAYASMRHDCFCTLCLHGQFQWPFRDVQVAQNMGWSLSLAYM